MVDMFGGLIKISLKVIVQPKCTAVRKTSFEWTNAKTHDRKMALWSANLTKNFSAHWSVSGKNIFFPSSMQRVRENTPDELVTIPLWFQWTPNYGHLWKFSREMNKGNLSTNPRVGEIGHYIITWMIWSISVRQAPNWCWLAIFGGLKQIGSEGT